MNDYQEKLKNPKWQKKRLEIFERDSFRCRTCMNDKEQIHVHHLRYDKSKMPWEYNNDDLLTVCSTCHEQLHSGEIRIAAEMEPMTLIYENGGQDISLEFHNKGIEWFNKK